MKQRIYEIPIDHPLTGERRKAIGHYIASHSHLVPANLEYAWDKETRHILQISTPPVKWEIKFSAKQVEIFGAAPLWASLLFTEEKRLKLKGMIELILSETGFFDDKRTKRESKKAAKVKKGNPTPRA